METEKKSYAELFGLKYCHDMPDLSKDPTIIRLANEAVAFLTKHGLPDTLINRQ